MCGLSDRSKAHLIPHYGKRAADPPWKVNLDSTSLLSSYRKKESVGHERGSVIQWKEQS